MLSTPLIEAGLKTGSVTDFQHFSQIMMTPARAGVQGRTEIRIPYLILVGQKKNSSRMEKRPKKEHTLIKAKELHTPFWRAREYS